MPLDFSTQQLGAVEPRPDPRTLPLASFLLRPPGAAPPWYDLQDTIGTPPPYDSGNHEAGCCTCSTCCGLIRRFEARERQARWCDVPKRRVLSTYLRLAGGVDAGLPMLTALVYWRRVGFLGPLVPDQAAPAQRYRISGYFGVDQTNPDHVREAISVFGGITLTLGLPRGWQSGFSTDPAFLGILTEGAGELGGAGWHEVFAVAYTPEGVLAEFESWSCPRQLITWRALAEYAPEIYAPADAWTRVAGAVAVDDAVSEIARVTA